MFSFFKKKSPPEPIPAEQPVADSAAAPVSAPPATTEPLPPSTGAMTETADNARQVAKSAPERATEDPTEAEPAKASSGVFSFFRKKPLPPQNQLDQPPVGLATEKAPVARPIAPPKTGDAPEQTTRTIAPEPVVPTIANAVDKPVDKPVAPSEARKGWLERLKTGLRRTGTGIATVFTGTKIDDALYEELEEALLMADTGVKATEHLLTDLKRRVKEAKATDPAAVKGLLADAIVALLEPLQKTLVIGEFKPTVIMVAGVNGAGKTTSIGKLTRHLADEGASVLLAAADTFRAAAREQLAVWADRNTVEIVTQEGGDPAAVSFDAVTAGRARGRDVVLVDTAGRLPTQLHLMEELRKVKRVVQKADPTGPHEVLLVIDGNTGQNALAQVKAFDDTLGLTGLVITKLDGTAKGGVICAIAREKPVPIYFIGVGEKLEDLETFNAREFAQALLS
jgi:fused signal recognition particle receptor